MFFFPRTWVDVSASRSEAGGTGDGIGGGELWGGWSSLTSGEDRASTLTPPLMSFAGDASGCGIQGGVSKMVGASAASWAHGGVREPGGKEVDREKRRKH